MVLYFLLTAVQVAVEVAIVAVVVAGKQALLALAWTVPLIRERRVAPVGEIQHQVTLSCLMDMVAQQMQMLLGNLRD